MSSVSRREFLRLSALTGVATVAAACVQAPATSPVAEPTTAPAQPTSVPAPTAAPAATPVPVAEPTAAPSRYSEAPELAELAAKADLPPVEERLPENPFVIEGLDGIGKYGGTWRMGFKGQGDTGSVGYLNARGVMNINHELTVHPYIAESWEINADATEFTFYLRKGMRWSDGEPFTSADFVYYYEDDLLNEELTPKFPTWLTTQVHGEEVPVVVTAPDDYTVKFTFAAPYAIFYTQVGVVTGTISAPSHYLKQFHKGYADADELAAMLRAKGYDDWTQQYIDATDVRKTVDAPTLSPWIINNLWTDELVTFRRNPYFWEVDTAGNQLPYIDKLQFRLFLSPDVYIMWVVNGEIDCQGRHAGTFDNFTVLKENEALGDYTVQNWRWVAVYALHCNQTAKDPRVRELFSERESRIAISHIVDRDEMRELLFEGFGTNMQYSPPEDSPLYYEKLAKVYLEFDPEKANALIDGLGYTERDAEGYRLWKDGSKERVRWTMIGEEPPAQADLLLTDYISNLGFEVNYRGMERSARSATINANEGQCLASYIDRGLVPLADPQNWIPMNYASRMQYWAYGAWYVDPTDPNAEEPPEGHPVKQMWDLWEQVKTEPDEEKRNALFKGILDIWAEELPAIGFFGDTPRLIVVKNGFKGIKEGYGWDCCATVYEYIVDDATWYWDEPEKHTA